jgi:hypothetical protein
MRETCRLQVSDDEFAVDLPDLQSHMREGKLLAMILLLCPKTVEGDKKEA